MQHEELGAFAQAVYEQKYAHRDHDGTVTETWPETAKRVAVNVMEALLPARERR